MGAYISDQPHFTNSLVLLLLHKPWLQSHISPFGHCFAAIYTTFCNEVFCLPYIQTYVHAYIATCVYVWQVIIHKLLCMYVCIYAASCLYLFFVTIAT